MMLYMLREILEYYLSKTPEELEKEFGTEVSRMVGFAQNNSHHCYDLWEHTLRTVEELVKKVKEEKLPVEMDNYFVKKAEIILDKVLGKNHS